MKHVSYSIVGLAAALVAAIPAAQARFGLSEVPVASDFPYELPDYKLNQRPRPPFRLWLVQAQGVKCHYVPNGSNVTLACDNGYWLTRTPDGEEFSGVGPTDPNATASGSGIVINPATGGIDITHGQTVTPPTQTLPMLEPHQAEQFGLPPRLD